MRELLGASGAVSTNFVDLIREDDDARRNLHTLCNEKMDRFNSIKAAR